MVSDIQPRRKQGVDKRRKADIMVKTTESPYQERLRDRPYDAAATCEKSQGAKSGGSDRKMRVQRNANAPPVRGVFSSSSAKEKGTINYGKATVYL